MPGAGLSEPTPARRASPPGSLGESASPGRFVQRLSCFALTSLRREEPVPALELQESWQKRGGVWKAARGSGSRSLAPCSPPVAQRCPNRVVSGLRATTARISRATTHSLRAVAACILASCMQSERADRVQWQREQSARACPELQEKPGPLGSRSHQDARSCCGGVGSTRRAARSPSGGRCVSPGCPIARGWGPHSIRTFVPSGYSCHLLRLFTRSLIYRSFLQEVLFPPRRGQ